MASPKSGGLFSKLPFFKKKAFTRRHTRHDCCIIATLTIDERHFELDGVILELSRGGVLFRPASTYILDRYGERVTARFEGIEGEGIIANVRPQGYGVRFREELPEAAIDELVSRYGLKRIAEAA